jgi:hypothetical protein
MSKKQKIDGGTGVPPVQAARRAAGRAGEYEMQRQGQQQEQKQQRRAGAPALHFPVQL